ncbi:MAG: A/G-specific adenine glycosylase, partial [Acidobacteria bacterium]|nr:A/G-specific adenine glycosylase [Acidobacteriota bacterium]
MRAALLGWYGQSRRDLPWRRTRDPYRIWVSEVMLQQTRVAAVLPYYERFLARFPDIGALARASEEEVLKLWSGLGYYSRARNLSKAARQAGGPFPRSYDGIRSLAGIGDYTAAAIASIAFDLPYPVLDGNVVRVLARLTAEPGDVSAPDTRRKLHGLAGSLLERARPGEFNQALMELGATVCLPRAPQCHACPLARWCRARAEGCQAELPVKAGRLKPFRQIRTLLFIKCAVGVLMWQRSAESRRLAGFWELPECEQAPAVRIGEKLGEFR